MEMLAASELEPCARIREHRPRDLPQFKNVAVKAAAGIEIERRDENVMKGRSHHMRVSVTMIQHGTAVNTPVTPKPERIARVSVPGAHAVTADTR
jgi:hypothetical protein